jgi:hypothetical protein
MTWSPRTGLHAGAQRQRDIAQLGERRTLIINEAHDQRALRARGLCQLE